MTTISAEHKQLIAEIKYRQYATALEKPSVKNLRGKAAEIRNILNSESYVWTDFETATLVDAYCACKRLAEKYEGYDD